MTDTNSIAQQQKQSVAPGANNSINTTAHTICPNCGSEISGEYCSACGQKKTDVHDRSIKTFFTFFFNEFFSWDSKFFSSIKYVIIKPGYLTNEYINGRMASYITPLKLYLCMSLVYFFVNNIVNSDQYSILELDRQGTENFFANWVNDIREIRGVSEDDFKERFNSELNDKLPIYMLIIVFLFSVPLKIVEGKKFYVEHLTFTLHFFTFVLFCMLLDSIINPIVDWSTYLIVFLIPPAYLLFAFRKVYKQNWIITIFEAGLFSAYYLGLLTALMIFALLISSAMA